MIKTRVFPESNYKGIFFNGKTLRIALDPTKPITELEYPEFYDIKLTSKCQGNCPYCYMDSKKEYEHVLDAVEKINTFFGPMNANQRPFQTAIGGGEPTESPVFVDTLKAFDDLGIMPNYTTNGMFIETLSKDRVQEIIQATKLYCGGVAVSCHPHLNAYWKAASQLFYINDIKLNFHIIISDRKSSNYFSGIYDEWKDKVAYFVLLPYGNQGRAEPKEIDWDYLVSVMPEDTKQIAFGANFYPYLCKDPNRFNVSLYEPEIMSKFLDLETMKLYPSSFNLEEI